MREFIKGWRRKAGVLTLVMACLLMAGWVRSFYRQDSIEFCPRQSIYCTSSGYGYFGIMRFQFRSRDAALSASTIPLSPLKALNLGWASSVISDAVGELEPWKGAESEWHWKWNGFHTGALSYTTINQHFDKVYVIVPYWSIVLPLTLLSACLLLSKPRPATAKQVREPARAEAS